MLPLSKLINFFILQALHQHIHIVLSNWYIQFMYIIHRLISINLFLQVHFLLRQQLVIAVVPQIFKSNLGKVRRKYNYIFLSLKFRSKISSLRILNSNSNLLNFHTLKTRVSFLIIDTMVEYPLM